MTHPFIEFLQKKYYIDDPDNAFEMFCESNHNQILAMIEDYKQSSVDSLIALHSDQMAAQQQEIDRLTEVKLPTMNPQRPPGRYDKNNPRPVA